MAARKGKSQARRGGNDRRVPGWIWLLAGVLLGLALSAFVLMREGMDGRRSGPQPNPAAQAPQPIEPPVAQESVEPKKPRYDFYTLLRDRETAIPDSELSARAEAEANAPAPAAPPSGERYLLQAGAFRNGADAEALKARLALLGLVARVQADTIDGNVWHRVRLGPFNSLRELEAAKQQLSGNGIEALAVREAKG